MNQGSKILDLGCGKKKRPGTIGVDYSDRHDADVIHDLNVFPYPFESDSIDKVYLDNVLEHLDEPMRVMNEVHRITKTGGEVKVIVPYFRSVWAFIDPTHKTFILWIRLPITIRIILFASVMIMLIQDSRLIKLFLMKHLMIGDG